MYIHNTSLIQIHADAIGKIKSNLTDLTFFKNCLTIDKNSELFVKILGEFLFKQSIKFNNPNYVSDLFVVCDDYHLLTRSSMNVAVLKGHIHDVSLYYIKVNTNPVYQLVYDLSFGEGVTPVTVVNSCLNLPEEDKDKIRRFLKILCRAYGEKI